MDVITALREQLGSAHWLLEQTMDGVTPEVFRWVPKGAATGIADNYLHTVIGEDQTTHTLLQAEPTLLSGLGAAKSGLSSLPAAAHGGKDWDSWIAAAAIDLDAFRSYAAAVHAATDSYLAGLTPADLARPVDLAGFGLGVQSLNWTLYNFLIGHVAQHTGEISSIKGFQGLRGYPF